MQTLKSWSVRLSPGQSLAVALAGVGIVAAADYATGHEIAMSLFYLGPVGFAAWACGRFAGVLLAVLSTVAWYAAEIAVYTEYSHPFIPIWNSLIRFGFFLSGALLIAALRSAIETATFLARTDPLTGIHNRRAFLDRLEHDLILAKRHQSPVTIACVDVDEFKAVNDAFGHAQGDQVLQIVATVMLGTTRRVDTAARLGGDEFAMVLPDTDASGARNVLERIVSELRLALGAAGLDVTCSIGAVTMTKPGESTTELLAAADALMYEVKRSGKGGVAYREYQGDV